MVLYLKEHRHVALHVACGDITDVIIENGKLVILTPDNTVLSVLKDGLREIERALSWQGLDMGCEVKLKIIPPSKVDEDAKILEKMFGKKFEIIE